MPEPVESVGAASRLETVCFHCGLPVPQGIALTVEVEGRPEPTCCHGCQAVAKAIVDGGLADFYRHRTATARRPSDGMSLQRRRLELYDREDVQRSFVRNEPDQVRETSLIIEGIVCAACVWLSERHVSALPGVLEFRVNMSTHRAVVRWNDTQIHLSRILEAVTEIGYAAHPFEPGRHEARLKDERAAGLRRLAIAGLGTMQVMMLAVAMYAGDYHGMDETTRRFLRWTSALIAVPVLAYAGFPFLRNAWRNLKSRWLGMDVPVSLAIVLAFTASVWATLSNQGEVYFDSVTMFIFFLLTARFLEMSARHRAGRVTDELLRIMPATATRIGRNGDDVVAVAELVPGDTIRVSPGETIATDGQVVAGRSSANESLITGESLPVPKCGGDSVIGGSVNVDSPLEVRVERVGADTLLSAIVRLLDRAQSEKPRIAALADRVAGWFVLSVLILAAAVAAWWWQRSPADALWVTLSVLVVTCPCALSLATPAAITAATGALTRMGLLITRGHALETLARATHVVFDKTGTLTCGRLQVTRVVPLADVSERQCLALSAALEQGSEHPVARAILEAAGSNESAAVEIVNTPGSGVQGRVDGARYRLGTAAFADPNGRSDIQDPAGAWVLLCGEHGPLARIYLRDSIRPDAAASIRDLRRLGLHPVLLSGDRCEVVESVAQELGIDEFRGRVSPQEKLRFVRSLQAAGGTVAMVGDGINDAPVLAGAHVSVAMGSGTQLAQSTADMVLLSERLDRFADGVRVARKSGRVIRQNLTWALAYNALALPLAASGWIRPWMAAIGMSLSSLLVVLNSLRLRPAANEDQATAMPLPETGERREVLS